MVSQKSKLDITAPIDIEDILENALKAAEKGEHREVKNVLNDILLHYKALKDNKSYYVDEPIFQDDLVKSFSDKNADCAFFLDILGVKAWANPELIVHLIYQLKHFMMINYPDEWCLKFCSPVKEVLEECMKKMDHYPDDDVIPDSNKSKKK